MPHSALIVAHSFAGAQHAAPFSSGHRGCAISEISFKPARGENRDVSNWQLLRDSKRIESDNMDFWSY